MGDQQGELSHPVTGVQPNKRTESMKSHYGLSPQENQGMLKGSHQWVFKHHGQSTVYWHNSHTAQFSSVAQSCPTLWPHGLQHARLPCPSLSPGVCLNSCPLSQWCHPTISSSVVPFSWLQSFPASESFPMSQFFVSRGQIIGISVSHSPANSQKEQKSAMKYLPRDGATKNIRWKALMSTS